MKLRSVGFLYLALSTLLLSSGLAYVVWRVRSLEPLTQEVVLSRPGSYSFRTNRVHASEYHPVFRLRLPSEAPSDWNWGPNYQRLWGETPPKVSISVRDGAGHVVVHEQGLVTRENDWIITGAPGGDAIEVYKFADFRGSMFASYVVTLEVLDASPIATAYHTQFVIQTVKAYALLGVAFGYILLWAFVLLAGGVLLFFYLSRAK